MKILNAALSIALAIALASGLTACNRGPQPKTDGHSPNRGVDGASGKIGTMPAVNSMA